MQKLLSRPISAAICHTSAMNTMTGIVLIQKYMRQGQNMGSRFGVFHAMSRPSSGTHTASRNRTQTKPSITMPFIQRESSFCFKLSAPFEQSLTHTLSNCKYYLSKNNKYFSINDFNTF